MLKENFIIKRKSIRTYTGEGVQEDQLKEILNSAYVAPVSMGDYGNYQISIITNKELLDEIDIAGAKIFNKPEFKPLYNTPILIVVSAKLTNGPLDNSIYSSSAIIAHNMILTAVGLGIGACHIWGAVMGINGDSDLSSKLNLPEGFSPICGLTIGHTDETYVEKEIVQNKITTNYIK